MKLKISFSKLKNESQVFLSAARVHLHSTYLLPTLRRGVGEGRDTPSTHRKANITLWMKLNLFPDLPHIS